MESVSYSYINTAAAATVTRVNLKTGTPISCPVDRDNIVPLIMCLTATSRPGLPFAYISGQPTRLRRTRCGTFEFTLGLVIVSKSMPSRPVTEMMLNECYVKS